MSIKDEYKSCIQKLNTEVEYRSWI